MKHTILVTFFAPQNAADLALKAIKRIPFLIKPDPFGSFDVQRVKWTPPTKQLPPPGKNVLVKRTGDRLDVAYYVKVENTGKFYTDSSGKIQLLGGTTNQQVTHWRPLAK